jgi:hypothetical protein
LENNIPNWKDIGWDSGAGGSIKCGRYDKKMKGA